MDDQACPAVIFIPLKAGEIWFVHLIIRLTGS